eukprot:scaffold1554_cov401-Prasinococcus_capsulatus_cf.AAC.4
MHAAALRSGACHHLALPGRDLHGRCTCGAAVRRSVVMASAAGRAQGSAGKSYIGLDFGTSGARAIAVDEFKNIVADVRLPYEGVGDEEWYVGHVVSSSCWTRQTFDLY